MNAAIFIVYPRAISLFLEEGWTECKTFPDLHPVLLCCQFQHSSDLISVFESQCSWQCSTLCWTVTRMYQVFSQKDFKCSGLQSLYLRDHSRRVSFCFWSIFCGFLSYTFLYIDSCCSLLSAWSRLCLYIALFKVYLELHSSNGSSWSTHFLICEFSTLLIQEWTISIMVGRQYFLLAINHLQII